MSCPRVGAGVYTIWDDGGGLVYVGIAGRNPSGAGLASRLRSHASGRRSGDQFCVYVADHYVMQELSRDQIGAIRDGELSMDALVRACIHQRFVFALAPPTITRPRCESRTASNRARWDGRRASTRSGPLHSGSEHGPRAAANGVVARLTAEIVGRRSESIPSDSLRGCRSGQRRANRRARSPPAAGARPLSRLSSDSLCTSAGPHAGAPRHVASLIARHDVRR